MEREAEVKDFLYPLRVLHGKLYEWRIRAFTRLRERFSLFLERLRNPRAVYLVYTPEHRNLGDHAIAQAEAEWLHSLHIPYLEVTGKRLEYLRKNSLLNTMDGRPILIHGGGFLGTIWPESERLLRAIIKSNPHSEILLLPNTIYYDKNAEGEMQFEESIQIYNSHKHFKLYAREKVSFEVMQKAYNCVSLSPDLVLRLNRCQSGVERHGGLLCLRTEKRLGPAKQKL